MKARSTWPTAFLVVFLGCSSGTVGTGYGNGPGSGSDVGGTGNGGGPGTGSSVGSGVQVGSGVASGGAVTATCPGCTLVDGGVEQPDGSIVPLPLTPPSGGVVVQTITKLTATEYANTVNDLFGTAIGLTTSLAPLSAQTVPLGADTSAGGFSIGGSSTDQTAQAYQDSALQIATLVTSTTNLPILLKSACPTLPAANSGAAGATCATAFINQFAPLAFRHGPLDAGTLGAANPPTGLIGVYTDVAVTQGAGFSGGIAALLEEMLQSPYFLYHLETEEQALGMYMTAIPVTGYSMANRLSYLLWSSMPDATLFTAASGGELSTAAQVSGQAQRMLQDPRAHVGLRNFYEQWLVANQLPNGKVGTSTQYLPNGTLSATSLFGTTNGESFATVYSPALQQAIVDSFDMQVEAALWAGSNVMTSLLTSTTVYANAALAPIFGITGVTGTMLQPVQVDGTKRVGILSHPLQMATQATTATSHPVFRGRWVWDQIVCQPLPNPPAGVPAFVPPKAGMSLRQDFELLTATGPYAGMTSAAPSIPCPSCHERIDPIGFLFEPFDTIGQMRTIDDYGQPVDMTNITVVQAADPALNIPMTSAVQLAQALSKSDLVTSCITANLYRYMIRRNDAAADFPIEAWLDQTFVASGQNLSPVLVGLTQTDAFLERMNAQ
jgi:hypothetical protein